MTFFSRMRTGRSCLLIATVALPLFYGCQSGQGIVARLNGAAVNDTLYRDRLERVNINNFNQTLTLAGHPYVPGQPTDPNMDAGAVALIQILRENAIDQLAKEANAIPSPGTVDQFFNYQKLQNPKLDKQVVPTDFKHSIAVQLEVLGVGTDGAKVDAKEVQDEFNRAKSQLDIPERWGLRLLRVPNETDGLETLNRLKATSGTNFPEEAAKSQAPPPFNGQERFADVKEIQSKEKNLYDALQHVKPGQFASAPINIALNAPAGTPPLYVVAQLTQRFPATPVTLEMVQGAITMSLLQRKFPEYEVHFFQRLTEFFQKHSADLEIYDKRRENLVKTYLMQPPALRSAPTGAAGTPQGAPQGAPPTGNGGPPLGGGPASSSSGPGGTGSGSGNGMSGRSPGNPNSGGAGAP